GEDPDAVEAARARWSEGKAKGLDVTYWRPDEEGRWERLGWGGSRARCRRCSAMAAKPTVLRRVPARSSAIAVIAEMLEYRRWQPIRAEGNNAYVSAHRLCGVGDS